jgi:hypothetical protein
MPSPVVTRNDGANMSASGLLGRGGRPVAAAAVLGIAVVVGTGLLAVSAERQQVEVTRDATAAQGLASANDEGALTPNLGHGWWITPRLAA